MENTKIVVIDYGMGNLGSIANMIKKVGQKSIITSDANIIAGAEKIILPGIGAFAHGMSCLKTLKVIDVLNHKVLEKKTPVLGICLGMHLMAKFSEEGNVHGLGWIDADVKLFESTDLKVPHMGWNSVEQVKSSSLYKGLNNKKRFYFVHSYYVSCNRNEDILTTTTYGTNFVSSFEKDNIFGTQFHPEKSHKFGLQLFKNFLERTPC